MKAIKKKKDHGLRWWKKKVWQDVFSPYIRLKCALQTTGGSSVLLCCTCGKPYPAFGVGCAQAGHLVPGRNGNILFDERGVYGQCYNCNITLKGNWPEYVAFLKRLHGDENGQQLINELLSLNKQVKKYTVPELQELYETYRQKLEDLRQRSPKKPMEGPYSAPSSLRINDPPQPLPNHL